MTGAGGEALRRIGLASFGMLALELAMIRWTSGQVRIFAYFSNLVLIAAFLGMGVGMALGRSRPGLARLTLPALLVISAVLAFSGPIGLMHIHFPDRWLDLWGGAKDAGGVMAGAGQLAAFFALFLLTVTLFVFAGARLGELFGGVDPLRAYAANLSGSLLGVLAFTLATSLGAGPPVWLLLGGAPFAWLSRRWIDWGALAGVALLGVASVDGAVFSAYNRIDRERVRNVESIAVNRDFHQYMHDLSDARLADPSLSEAERRELLGVRRVYGIPFVVNRARGSALVVGAGTGNDVKAALRNGYEQVVSLDIDAGIIAMGRAHHPERPYDDPRVTAVVNDARAFFEQYRGPPFDVVCFGLLDSHAMFSALSSLRLENFVYTEEGIRAAWRHVSPDGHLSISFSLMGGRWLADRLYWTIRRATGVVPIMLDSRMQYGCTFLVARPGVRLDVAQAGPFEQLEPIESEAVIRPAVDDWPFLYLQHWRFPWGYAIVLLGVMGTGVVLTTVSFGGLAARSRFDLPLFLMGAGFLLLETRGVTSLALLFGSTWVVNAAVFAGILMLALLANFQVMRFGPPGAGLSFALLFVALGLLFLIPTGQLSGLPPVARGLLGGTLTGLPIAFAGFIVSGRLARAVDPAAALGSNILGAVLGGCLEYLSMAVGLRALILLAALLYAAAFLSLAMGGRSRT